MKVLLLLMLPVTLQRNKRPQTWQLRLSILALDIPDGVRVRTASRCPEKSTVSVAKNAQQLSRLLLRSLESDALQNMRTFLPFASIPRS